MKKYLFGVLYGLLLTSFTAYVLLDTFVISHVYENVSQVQEADVAATETEVTEETTQDVLQTVSTTEDNGTYALLTYDVSGNDVQEIVAQVADEQTQEAVEVQDTAAVTSPVVSDGTYQDENISIEISEYYVNDTTVYVADVQVSSAEYLKTALAQNAYGKNVTATTSDIAADNNAIIAINGDYYGAQEKGYVLRNGTLYRSTASRDQEDLVIYADGSFDIINESEVSAEDLLAQGAEQILSFGPALVMNGEIAVTADEEVGKAKTSNPRTAIGILSEGHYVFVVSDGRTGESEGLTLYELAEFMQSLGVQTAYNLDGGGSSTMVLNGELINNPTTSGRSIKERSVSDIVYIGY